MAVHEFGILSKAPVAGQRFDSYRSTADSVQVDDRWIEPLLESFARISFFWHCLDCPGMGLAYTGITLIPPSTIDRIAPMLGDEHLSALKALLLRAKDAGQFVIHFGI